MLKWAKLKIFAFMAKLNDLINKAHWGKMEVRVEEGELIYSEEHANKNIITCQ